MGQKAAGSLPACCWAGLPPSGPGALGLEKGPLPLAKGFLSRRYRREISAAAGGVVAQIRVAMVYGRGEKIGN